MPRRGSSCRSSARGRPDRRAGPGRAGPGRTIARAIAIGCASLIQACARQGLPEGGTRDLVPPRVVATSPDSGATRVPLDAEVTITFSEPMDRASVLDWVLLSPPRDFGNRDWSGNTFHLGGGEDFPPDVTTTVVVGTGCRDERERNPMAAPYLFVFSTGDSLDRGRIEGRLLAKGQDAHGTVVWAVDLEHAAARPDTTLPDYVTQVGADSTFTLIGLKAGRRYWVLAHFDPNRDREFDRETEFLAASPDTLWLDPAHPLASGVAIDFRDPRAPGSITGTVIDSTGAHLDLTGTHVDSTGAVVDSTGAVVDSTRTVPVDSAAVDSTRARPRPILVEAWAHAAAADTTAADTTAAAQTQPDSLGSYELRNLAPGLYRVQAFLDWDGDRRYDAEEPASSAADSVQVIPLEKTGGVNLVVRERR